MFLESFCLFLILLYRIERDKKHLTNPFNFQVAAPDHAPDMIYMKAKFIGGFCCSAITNEIRHFYILSEYRHRELHSTMSGLSLNKQVPPRGFEPRS